MNLVLTAAFPLTRTYTTEQRVQQVQAVDENGSLSRSVVAGRMTVEMTDEVVDVRVVDRHLDAEEQAVREATVISRLAAVVQELGALDARLATRFHGVVDLNEWVEG